MKGPDPNQESVVLAFCGTEGDRTGPDWRNDLEAQAVPFTKIPSVSVHKGFNDSVDSFFGQGIVKNIQARLKGIDARLKGNAKLYITGHSKGGALAFLAAFLLSKQHPEIKKKLGGVVTFEAPRAGGKNFVAAYEREKIPTLRYEFQDDIAPHFPKSDDKISKFLADLLATDVGRKVGHLLFPKAAAVTQWQYEHVGTLRFIDWSGRICGDSPALQDARRDHLKEVFSPGNLINPIAVKAGMEQRHAIFCGSGLWKAIAICKGLLPCPPNDPFQY